MPVIPVHKVDELQKLVAKDPENLKVIDIGAKWCGPCRGIAPFIEELSKKYTYVTFYTVDMDECPSVKDRYQIRALPTFVLMKNGKEVDKVEGANQNVLEKLVHEHSKVVASIFAGSGRKLGAGEGKAVTESTPKAGMLCSDNTNYDEALAALRVDETKPTTRIQIVWPDGSKYQLKLNKTSPISAIRDFICNARPEFAFQPFSLNTKFPNRTLSHTEEHVSLQEGKLEQGTVTVKIL